MAFILVPVNGNELNNGMCNYVKNVKSSFHLDLYPLQDACLHIQGKQWTKQSPRMSNYACVLNTAFFTLIRLFTFSTLQQYTTINILLCKQTHTFSCKFCNIIHGKMKMKLEIIAGSIIILLAYSSRFVERYNALNVPLTYRYSTEFNPKWSKQIDCAYKTKALH